MVLLTINEKLWIEGRHDLFSKGYQRKLKHDIKKKLQQLYQVELPLLIQKGLVSNPDLSVSSGNGVTNTVTTNCNNKNKSKLQHPSSFSPTEQENR